MGEVYLAEHVDRGTRVAIKLLLPHVSADAAQVQRFFNEAIAVAAIQHAGTAKIFDSGTAAGRAYLVMEFLPGETLAARIRRHGRLPLARAAELGKQIAGVLEAVHRAGITHRDLKPDNVFVVPDDELASGERIKIVDFGIAKLSGIGGGMTATTASALGTPAYMSPEQWRNAKHVDWRADAYSLGCVAFEMIAGRPPFFAETIGEACAKHLTEEPPRLASLVEVPVELDALIAQLLAKAPDARPASMRAIADAFAAIAAVVDDRPAPAVDTPPEALPVAGMGATQVTVRPSPPPAALGVAVVKRPPYATWLAIAAGVGLVVMGVVMVRGCGAAESPAVQAIALAPPDAPETPPATTPDAPDAPAAPPRDAPRAPPPSAPPPSAIGATSKVQISSKPTGAIVKIDDVERGTTPLALALAPGRYRLTVWFAGAFKGRYIDVERGKPTRYNFDFSTAAVPSGRPARLPSGTIQNLITRDAGRKIFACRNLPDSPTGPIVDITVDPSGRIASLRDAATPQAARGDCILRAIRDLAFPPSAGGGMAKIPYPRVK